MGRFLIGEEVCNNCVHWLCRTERKFRGNPPKEVYTESNCDECSVTGKNTLSKNTCAAFKHIGGITKTFPARTRQSDSPFDGMTSDLDESTRTLLTATMEYEKNKLTINKARQILSENDGDGDDNGEALANALAKHGDAVAEQKRANERATELLDEGMDPKCMFQDKSVEFMHMLDSARSGNPEAQYEFAKAFWDGSHGALSAESLSAMNKSRIPHDWCRKAAENGLTEAEYHIGHCGWDGKEMSVEWLRRAADKGHAAAKSELEELVSELAGNSMELLTKCITVLSSKKSDEGISEAISCIREASLILSHSDGWSTTVPLYKLDEWFVNNFIKTIESIADTGLPDLQNVIGKMFGAYSSFESIVKKDWGSAVRWFEHAAESGCLEAMDNLGTCFANGNGVVKNDMVAADWYRKAALGGLDLGQYHYACRLMSGEGVAKDIEEARNWLQKAAAQGLEKAKDALVLFEASNDDCTPHAALHAGWVLYKGEDYKSAVCHFKSAASFGLAEAMFALAKCYRFGEGVEKDEALAVAFAQKAAKHGVVEAQYMIASCAEDGCGMPKDEMLALGWYLKAAANGHASAMYSVGRLYSNGIGTQRDEELGEAWKKRAKANGYEPW